MAHKDEVLRFLSGSTQRFCDDCLSEALNIYPRQRINQICNQLTTDHSIQRSKVRCDGCKKEKLINSL